ncbi:MAG: hypothetical protein ACP5EN_06210 [Rhodovulum sp.]
MARDPRESDSPILFLGISTSYSHAFRLLWQAEFQDKHPFHWDKYLIFHPLANMLGIALETGLKGLLVCRQRDFPEPMILKRF